MTTVSESGLAESLMETEDVETVAETRKATRNHIAFLNQTISNLSLRLSFEKLNLYEKFKDIAVSKLTKKGLSSNIFNEEDKESLIKVLMLKEAIALAIRKNGKSFIERWKTDEEWVSGFNIDETPLEAMKNICENLKIQV
jgi:hypothetical protein